MWYSYVNMEARFAIHHELTNQSVLFPTEVLSENPQSS